MKILIAVAIILLSFGQTSSHGQSWYRYDNNGNVVDGSTFKSKPGKPVELKDNLTGNKYVLDENHITITAIDKTGKVLWKTDPWKDNGIMEYRTKRPVIVYFELSKRPDYLSDKIKEGSMVIRIAYNNTQFGVVDSNGKFYFSGQD